MSAPGQPANEEHRQVRFAAPPGATQILLIRHGESAPFQPDQPFSLVDGHGDPALHPNGVKQADRVGERLQSEKIDAIYVTKLQRTHQTAAPLAAILGMTPVVDPDLHEVFLGDWEGGLVRQKVAELDPIYLQMQAEQDWGCIPNAESQAALTTRCVRGIRRIAAAHTDQMVAVVVHGGVIGALLSFAAGSRGFAFNGADNGSIHHLVVNGDEWKIRCFNDTSHLGRFTSEAQAPT